MIIDSQPLTVALLASVLFGERLGALGFVGLGLGVVGLCLLEVPVEALQGELSFPRHTSPCGLVPACPLYLPFSGWAALACCILCDSKEMLTDDPACNASSVP